MVGSVPPLGAALGPSEKDGWSTWTISEYCSSPSSSGTAMLVLLGCGVVANVALAKTKGFNGGFLMVTFGWGFAVFAGVIVAYASGAHINPAVTLGLVANGAKVGTEFAHGPGRRRTCRLHRRTVHRRHPRRRHRWLAYKQHFDEEPDPRTKLGSSRPAPASATTPGTSSPRSSARSCWSSSSSASACGRHGDGGLAAARCAAGGPPRDRHRRLPRWPDRLRDQPGARPRTPHRARVPPDQGQGRQRLVLRVGSGRGPDHRRPARRLAAIPLGSCSITT